MVFREVEAPAETYLSYSQKRNESFCENWHDGSLGFETEAPPMKRDFQFWHQFV